MATVKPKQAAEVTKLLLVRTVNAKADLLDKAGLSGITIDKPLSVRPCSMSAGYNEESPPTHYGYVFKGLKREDRDKLTKFDTDTEGTSLHQVDSTVAETLASLGLQVCEG